MIPFSGDPTVADLMFAIQQQLSIPIDTQRFFKFFDSLLN